MTVCWVGVRSRPGGRLGTWVGSHTGTVGEDWDALVFADPEDPVGTGAGEVVGAAGQCERDPHQPPFRSPRLSPMCPHGIKLLL